MRWYGVAALAAVGIGALVGVGGALAATPEGGAATTPHGDAQRGQYLLSVVGCDDCHTPGSMYGQPDMTRRFSGSELGWQGPWGVSFASNLTSDAATGIGSWSEDDIVKAIRTGVRPDGSKLSPPMPWPHFANLTDDDAYALAAALKQVPPVVHQVPAKVAPGGDTKGLTVVTLPAPPAWDAPRGAGGATPSMR